MQFVLDSGIYKAVRITGPKHNLLGLAFGKTDAPIKIMELPIKEGQKRNIESAEVLSQVMQGLEYINEELGANFKISKVQFVPSDTPSKNVYRMLTEEIIKRLNNKGDFKKV